MHSGEKLNTRPQSANWIRKGPRAKSHDARNFKVVVRVELCHHHQNHHHHHHDQGGHPEEEAVEDGVEVDEDDGPPS